MLGVREYEIFLEMQRHNEMFFLPKLPFTLLHEHFIKIKSSKQAEADLRL
jgi:hypothetical protein